MLNRLSRNEIVTPTASEIEIAKESCRLLAQFVEGGKLHIRFGDGPDLKECILPQSAGRVLLGILAEMSHGNSTVFTALQPEITTQQAADLLNVSRPYLVKLVDEGAIPSRKVGVQRRLLLDDVIAYKKAMYAKQLNGMAELTKLSQEMGLYDEPPK